MNYNRIPSKLTLVLLMCTLVPVLLFSNSINYLSDSYESISQKGKSQNKYFFVKFSADWCAPCKVMDSNVNNNPTLVNFVQDNFLAVKADIDDTTGKEWKDKFNACCLPTLVVFSPDGYELGRKEGTIPSSEFLSFLENAIGKKATLVMKNTTPSFTLNERPVINTKPKSKPKPQFVTMTSKGTATTISAPVVSQKWTLLISKHSELKDANKEIKTLKNKLDDAILLTAKMDNQRLIYQVSIGNISNEQEAIMLRKKLKAKDIRSSIIKE